MKTKRIYFGFLTGVFLIALIMTYGMNAKKPIPVSNTLESAKQTPRTIYPGIIR